MDCPVPFRGSPAVASVDTRQGALWLLYENQDETSYAAPNRTVTEFLHIDLDTLEIEPKGPVSAADRIRNRADGAVRDNRAPFTPATVLSYNFNQAEAYIENVELLGTTRVKISYRLYSRDSRKLNVDVKFSFGPPGFRPAMPASDPSHEGDHALTSSPTGELHAFVHELGADVKLPFTGDFQYEVTAYDTLVTSKDVDPDLWVDVWVSGIVHGCGYLSDAIQVDGVPVATRSIVPGACLDCPTMGAQTPGAVLVKSGPFHLMVNARLSVCTNQVPNGNTDCVNVSPLDGATMWLAPMGRPNDLALCTASANPGEIVTFSGCSIEHRSDLSWVVGTPVCHPEVPAGFAPIFYYRDTVSTPVGLSIARSPFTDDLSTWPGSGAAGEQITFTFPGDPALRYRIRVRIRGHMEGNTYPFGSTTPLDSYGAAEAAAGYDPHQVQSAPVRGVRWGTWNKPADSTDRPWLQVGNPGEPNYALFRIMVREPTEADPRWNAYCVPIDCIMDLYINGGQVLILNIVAPGDPASEIVGRSSDTLHNLDLMPADDDAAHPLGINWYPRYPKDTTVFDAARRAFLQIDVLSNVIVP